MKHLLHIVVTSPNDLRHGLRALRRAPGHVATALLCLALGVIASTSAFSIVNALFYRELPGIADRATLRRVEVVRRDGVGQTVSTDAVRRLRSSGGVLAGIASEGTLEAASAQDGDAFSATVAFVSGSYFSVLGSRPALGRLIGDDDDRNGAEPVAVVSAALWRQRLGGRRDVLGHSITIGGRSFTIVGVAPERFDGLDISELGDAAGTRLQFWLPLSAAAAWPHAPDADSAWHRLVLRLAPGAHDAAVAAELQAAMASPSAGEMAAAVSLSPLGIAPASMPATIGIMLTWFLCLPLMVLAIGCANVANLQLARATDRGREVSVRVALGASRAQIVRLLTVEAIVLAGVVGVIGVLGTATVLHVVEVFVPLPLAIDWRVLAFTGVLGACVVLAAGLAPAWIATRRSAADLWRWPSRLGDQRPGKLRDALVALQVALSLVLLVTSALFARSLYSRYSGVPELTQQLAVGVIHLHQQATGLDPAAFLGDLAARLEVDPRVRSVAVQSFGVLRYGPPRGEDANKRLAVGGFVSANWFDTVGAEPQAGRLFTAADTPAVAVVNERLAGDLAPNGSAVGATLRLASTAPHVPAIVEVVGVIPTLRRPPDPADFRAIYLPMPREVPTSLTLVLRTSQPEALLVDLRRFDRSLAWADLSTGEMLFLRSLSAIRYLALSAGALGLAALLLAAAGLYAVTSYVVSLRRHEIGIRLAVGARPADVLRLIMGGTLRVVATGVGAGLLIVVPLAIGVRVLFEGITPIDPVAVGSVIGILVAAALVAGGLPARRAALVDPADTLKEP